jgi:kynurenine 3-monooxygenase
MAEVIVVGAGLIGPLLSVFLAKEGHRVTVYDRDPDGREASPAASRSINLTLCERGFRPLDRVGVGDIVRSISVPAYGRLIHSADGDLAYQPYGNNKEAIYSISRRDLNIALLNFAQQNFDIEFRFNEKCTGVDLATATLEATNSLTGDVTCHKADSIFACDGAYSATRLQLQKMSRFNYSQQYWEQGYKELSVPATATGGWVSEKNVLHIWPRGHYMLIGFPNLDGGFTCSWHIPFEGELSFESIRTEADLLRLFERSFPDAIPHMPNLVSEFFANPPNSMITIKCSPWAFRDKVVLMGDAAHAIYPSYGQGANAGFEDCAVIHECMQKYGEDWKAIFNEYETRRKTNTDAIADLCVEHFIELRDLVGDRKFLLKKEIERKINRMYPEEYKDLYSMITFDCMPYAEALRIDREQRTIIDRVINLERIEDRFNSTEVERLIDDLIRARRSHSHIASGK